MVLIVDAPGGPSGVTLTTIRRFVLPLLGPYARGTATSGSAVSALECTSYPFRSDLDQDSLYVDQYLYRPSASTADKERIVKLYTSSTGTFTPDLAWSAAAYSGGVGETFELSGLVSITAPENGLHALINYGLERCLIPREVTATPTADATRHSLTPTSPWISEPWQVRQVGYLVSGESRSEVDPYQPSRQIRGEAIKDTGSLYLVHPGRTFQATDTLYVKAIGPAYDACAAASTPTTFAQSGLVDEGDVCLPTKELVGWATVLEAQERIGAVLSQSADAQVKANLAKAAERFAFYQGREWDAVPRTFLPALRSWGPRR